MRDSLPPVLLNATPPDSSKNFNAKTITFTFDEYLDQIQDIQQNLLISPTPDVIPLVDVKLKTVIVKLKDTLESNTTYYFNFGNAIKDINEGNVLRDFSYIFSTGLILDSLELRGRVVLAETGKTDSTLIVMLHRSADDSAVKKEKPRYITRLDGSGNFRFRYLAAGTYYIYALKDESGTKRYEDSSYMFAFADKPVEIKPGAEPVTLYAYSKRKEQPIIPGLSIGRPVGTRTDDRRLKFSPNLEDNRQDLLGSFVINFEQPLRFFDSAKILLSTDSSFQPVPGYSWQLDSLKRRLTLQTSWKENQLYNIILDKEFAEDTLGRKLLKTDTLSFKTRSRQEYSSLKIRFRNFDLSKKPVLLFVRNDQIVKSFPLASENFLQDLFMPGEYELRILYDDNGNGKWDPGDFFINHRQPELVKPIERKINVRQNLENEFEIAVPAEN